MALTFCSVSLQKQALPATEREEIGKEDRHTSYAGRGCLEPINPTLK
jgi:hypothetical protein